jgi:peptide/nickel transport system permease protein
MTAMPRRTGDGGYRPAAPWIPVDARGEPRAATVAVPEGRAPTRSTARAVFTAMSRNPMAVAGGLVAVVLIVMAVAAPLIAPFDPLKADFRRMAKPPDARSLFGTDQVGRDTLSRVIHGARSSLAVAFASVLLGTTVGALWGVASGYLGGRFDLISQRVTEILQSFPDLILAMAISMAIGTGMSAVIISIAITRIPFGNRVIRSVAMTIREFSYVEAARAAGGSQTRVMLRHVLPQCVAPYLVLATAHLGVAIVIEAALGFLGVGIPPPTPTWGNMLADSLTSLVPRWWLVLFPGLAITITVLAFNLFGDGIRDTLDPRLSPALARASLMGGRRK